MAFIEHGKIFDGVDTLPKDVGYTIVSIYDENYGYGMHGEIEKWINKNVVGNWSCWIFSESLYGKKGRSFCFNNDADRIKFILRWS